jgi:hypothetical protein
MRLRELEREVARIAAELSREVGRDVSVTEVLELSVVVLRNMKQGIPLRGSQMVAH